MNQNLKKIACVLSFVSGLGVIATVSLTAGRADAARVSYTTGSDDASVPTLNLAPVINLDEVIIGASPTASHSAGRRRPVLSRFRESSVTGLHVLEQGGRPGGEFVIVRN